MELLVTGGAGFIGSHFIRLMLEKEDVSITNIDALTYAGHISNTEDFLANKNYRFIQADLTNAIEVDRVFEQQYDWIVHFAAESHVDRSINDATIFLDTNIKGTHNLLEKVRTGRAKKMIHVSTDEVYGSLQQGDKPFTEKHPLSPNNPYSASKAGADLLVRSYFKTYGIPVMITRCSNNYGPNQHPEKLIPKVIQCALHDQSIPLYGDGLNVRDWLYVEDHCRAIERVMKRGQYGEVYNVGGRNERSNKEVIKAILHFLGKDEHLITYVQDRQGHDRRYAIDQTKIQTELQWEPTYSFSEGLQKTINWYAQNEEWFHTMLKWCERK
ncbi:dTDP-glucose 4,6-dehydratase [Halalkalibacter hemicellulosilyticus]|uniref:dTDP-glucose 4,6-dehydratase n=1 Tax=Halalkalibacter hemicellulosilyticusJCM 9152 TaxID=1236971 RepID=W4QH21_9BACI|nr:dTDP-glucose 4,6-dehydratase [Halalkalibacter hemicellulosilyticus]GAE30923.1 dTDP-glucose 4,6-dehydratase [Halalkalibacter hemicellulosilyticusJCM 9152]